MPQIPHATELRPLALMVLVVFGPIAATFAERHKARLRRRLERAYAEYDRR